MFKASFCLTIALINHLKITFYFVSINNTRHFQSSNLRLINNQSNNIKIITMHLEAFTVDNGWARFVIFLLADPHLLERGEGSKNGSSNPYGVLPFWWSNNLDLHGWWGKSNKFLLHSVINSWVHRGTSRQDSVGVQVLSNVNITFHD